MNIFFKYLKSQIIKINKNFTFNYLFIKEYYIIIHYKIEKMSTYFKFNLSCWSSKKEILTVYSSDKTQIVKFFNNLDDYMHFCGTNVSGIKENMIRKVKKFVYYNTDNKIILHLSNDDGIKAKAGDRIAKKAVIGFCKDGKYRNMRIYLLTGKTMLTRSVEVKGAHLVNPDTNTINIKFRKSDVFPLLRIENNRKTLTNMSDIDEYLSEGGGTYLKIGDLQGKVDKLDNGVLIATVPELETSDINILTNEVSAELLAINDIDNINIDTCANGGSEKDASDYLLDIRQFDIDNFNDVLEAFNYDVNTITLKFRQNEIRVKKKESNTYTSLPEFIGMADNIERPYSISIGVYFLPKGKELKDCIEFNYLRYNDKKWWEEDDCADFYDLINDVSYSRFLNSSLGPSTTPDGNPNPEGLLTFEIENQGYAGINGNRRLYIKVAYHYRGKAPEFGFYVN